MMTTSGSMAAPAYVGEKPVSGFGPRKVEQSTGQCGVKKECKKIRSREVSTSEEIDRHRGTDALLST